MSEDSNIHVWLVEDNAAFRRSVARAIDKIAGMQCDRQFEAAEHLFTALREPPAPDVILLDVQLPGMDGITALADIRAQSPGVRTVILTAFDEPDKIFRAICAGASGYILKTSRLEQIGDAIRQVADGGSPMTPTVARKVLELFTRAGRRPAQSGEYHLTDREQDILRLMAEGLIKKEIADRLDISVHTVSTHIRSIYEKLHVNTNTGAVAKALREDLI